MTATERARREDALYHGEASRRDLCARVAHLEECAAARTARRVIVSDPTTDCATGHCECGGCGGVVDPWDGFCRHCGARMEDE